MSFDALRSPLAFFESVLGCYAPLDPGIVDYATWWQAESDARGDGSEVTRVLAHGYAAGIIRRVHVQESLLPSFALLYITTFHAPDIAAHYAGSLLTRHIVDKYAPNGMRESLLARLQSTNHFWQGGLWINLLTSKATQLIARRDGDGWRLSGELFACANLTADVALVSAQVDGEDTVAVFLVPRLRNDGSLNIHLANPEADALPMGNVTLRDSHALLMATPTDGAALRTEIHTLVLAFGNVMRVAVAQRMLVDADSALSERGTAVATHVADLRAALALVWAAAQVGDDTAREVAGLYSDTYARFRLLAQLAHFHSMKIMDALAAWLDTLILSANERRPDGSSILLTEPQGLSNTYPVYRLLVAELVEYTDAETAAVLTNVAIPPYIRTALMAQAYMRKFSAAASLI